MSRGWARGYGTHRPPPCPYCNAVAELVNGVDVYPDKPELANRRYWICRPCSAWVGTHDNSRLCAPMGTLANAELRVQRKRVYEELDEVRRMERTDRHAAIAWLSSAMGRTGGRLHIADLREPDCMSALLILAARLNRLRRNSV